MIRKYYIALLLIFIIVAGKAQQPMELVLQQRGEVVVSVDWNDLKHLDNLESLSIEIPVNGKSMVYLNAKQYKYFVDNNIPFVPEIAPSLLSKPKMAKSKTEMANWDAYPDYNTYLEMMEQFTIDFPDYCSIDTIGYSKNNRLLLALKITADVNNENTRPEFLYSSSMHGDELVGYVLMLRLADYLLNNMHIEKIANLVNNVNIYINPLANPDGTFYMSDETVMGAKRFNTNGVDINRNFPDPKRGNHPDGEEWQPETLAMIDYMGNHNFVLSMNHHGGKEVINYPWDTFYERHADDGWFKFVSRNYVDTVHAKNDSYMIDLNNGITNGYDWYEVAGGRQDYVNYFLLGREITAELSTVKLPAATTLPTYWDYNFKSLLNYINQSLYGVSGFITDTVGNPLKAKITVANYDADSTHVRTLKSGVYYRFLKEGNYTLMFEADGYQSKEVSDVVIEDFKRTELSVVLKKSTSVSMQNALNLSIYPNPTSEELNIDLPLGLSGATQITIHNILGTQVYKSVYRDLINIEINVQDFTTGVYHISIRNKESLSTGMVIIN